ncbi:hypothetical protein ISN45_Aa04g006670 [Arabidopsis thaliana x Arabidopsis arenosa]|uniref:Uncharacterized protein n=1 Tax=Arabidopsis thaliana x Arabidopsis arenosa TaxID=1240361 RepID=A0A8T2A7Z8_9BRAS|nr:hypothetical protein ISN45_Aa04g006670 [Arabidopsis thaliana x Arabidopsis arenosa]
MPLKSLYFIQDFCLGDFIEDFIKMNNHLITPVTTRRIALD